MKKLFLLGAMVCALGMTTACKSGTAVKNASDSIPDTKNDTLWGDDRGYWEIKTPYEENERTVLYRSCVFAGQEDGSVNEIELSYYLLRRGTSAYDSSLNIMQSINAKHHLDEMASSGWVYEPNTTAIDNMPQHWYPVRKYEGAYYLYKEGGCGIYFADGFFITAWGDYWAYRLKSVDVLSDGSYQFKYFGLNDTVETDTMKLVDKTTGLYRSTFDDMLEYYTTDDHLRKYDIIMLEGYPIVSVDDMKFDE